MSEVLVRNWRITGALPRGANAWFDPSLEYVRIFDIPHPDSDEGQSLLTKVATGEFEGYLDRVSSVSADGPGMADCELTAPVALDRPTGDPELPF